MKRSYETIIATHFAEHQQMVLVSGSRQVGKTTLARSIQSAENTHYFNWDDFNDRELLLQGGAAIAQRAGLDHLRAETVLLVFDEIHKFSQWKQLLKGFYDHYAGQCHILVTGSARMDTYKKGGDSLMGRYFNYRLHPFSVGELLVRDEVTGLHDLGLVDSESSNQEIYSPQNIPDTDFDALIRWGGFPEPLMKKNKRFFNRWSRLREQQLLQEDVRTLTNVQELGQLEMLAHLLKSQTGQLTSYTSLAKKVRVSVDTIRRWLVILESLYYCYSIRPWTKNITRSLIKEPKFYLWDWSQCSDTGARSENFIASHLLKAVHYWTDIGLGNYSLYFLRDKEKREVDFLVSRDDNPWFMVEVKSSMNQKLSPNLEVFRKQLNLEHVFQVAIDGEYVDQDVFSVNKPVIVPAKTFLSQLI